jgi:hypothetical protein
MITNIIEDFKGNFIINYCVHLMEMLNYGVTNVNNLGQVKPLRNICKRGSNFSLGLNL